VLTPDEIRANIAAVSARIEAACARAGRRRDDVRLVAVSKTFPAEAVDAAILAGMTDLGENRVQEARDKKPLVKGTARWHLIGHLQSNKAKDAVKLFDVIETVDSVALAEKIARAAAAVGKRQEVFLQVNVGGEEMKNAPLQISSTKDDYYDVVIGADYFLTHRLYVANGQKKIYATRTGFPGVPMFAAHQPKASGMDTSPTSRGRLGL